MVRTFLVLLILSKIISAQNVQIHGALKNIMRGNLESRFDLLQLQDRQNIYGLGAVAGLKGEIIVVNSRIYVSRAEAQNVVLDSSFSHKAALFAFSPLQSWQTDTINKAHSLEMLEKKISERAASASQPLAFLLQGEVQSLEWHVIDWQDGDSEHSHQKHKTAGLHGELTNEHVTIVGFYSMQHKGVLTHRDSNLHMHFVNKVKNLAGHVDNLSLKNAILKTAYEDN